MSVGLAKAAEAPPTGYVSLYSLTYDGTVQTDKSGTVAAAGDKQLVGYPAGWGDGILFYDIANYDSLAIKFTFDAADAGHQVALRIAWDKKGVTPYVVTFPNNGSTSFVYKIALAGKKHMDGMYFYNGKSHWSFSYTGTAASKATTIDYVAIKTVIATGIAITPMDSAFSKALPTGYSTTLKAAFTPANATYNAVTWMSMDTTIAKVSNSGVVTGDLINTGTATIKVKSVADSLLTATYNVTVIPIVNGSTIEITPVDSNATATLYLSQSTLLNAEFTPSNATFKTVTWSTSNPLVATVSNAGVVTANADSTGTAIIKATSKADTLIFATYVVTVLAPPVATVTLSDKTAKIEIGKTKTLGLTVLPLKAVDKSVAWTSSNTGVATVSNGLITAVTAGTSIIKAISVSDATKYDSCIVTVTPFPIDFVSLYSLTYDGTVQSDKSGTIAAAGDKQLVGYSAGWGDGILFYDIANYDSLAIKMTFDSADAGRQVALRIAWDKKGVTPYVITYPNDGSTSFVYKISLAGKKHLDGMYFYNGKSHWSFSYPGTVATKAVSINYVALKTVIPTSLAITAADSAFSKALPVGYTTTLKATFTPANATYNSVTWMSMDTTIAKVNSAGLVTANSVKTGTVAIKVTSVTYPALNATYNVVVIPIIAPTSLAITAVDSAKTQALFNSESTTLNAVFTPANTTFKSVTWTSLNPAIATVSSTGVVTAKADSTGFATIKVKSTIDTTLTATYNVLVIPIVHATGIAITAVDTAATLALTNGLTTTLNAVFTPANTTYKNVVWTSLDQTIANVSNTGVVTADSLNIGIARIKVSSATDTQVSDTFNVTVVAPIVLASSVNIVEDTVSVVAGNKVTLVANVLPIKTTDKTVIWSSSNTNVATVSNGVVTTLKVGTAKIKVVSATDSTLMDSCIVTSTLPVGLTSLYSLTYQTLGEIDRTGVVDAGGSKLMVGPGNGWGSGDNFYDISNNDTLVIKLAFDTADAGHQVALRIAWDKKGVTIYKIALPKDGSSTMVYRIPLTGKNHLDGMYFYNGAGHFSFTYDSIAASKAIAINYIALTTKLPVGIVKVAQDMNDIVNVYSVTGVMVRRAVKVSEATLGLERGLYIVGNKKVLVTR